MRTLATYIGVFAWMALAQVLLPMYNTLPDLLLLGAALVPGVVMLARRRISARISALGIALSAAALVYRFANRLFGLIKWDGQAAIGLLFLAHLAAFVLASLLTSAIFAHRGFKLRLASALSFGFLLILSAGIAAPDFAVDVQLKYAIGNGIQARHEVESLARFCGDAVGGAELDRAVRSCARLGLLSLPRAQLVSLSDRFFDSPFADDARLVAEVLLGTKSERQALAGLEPDLLSRRLDFHLETWTAIALKPWQRLFHTQFVSNEMLLVIAKRRIEAGQLADAEAALDGLITSGSASHGAMAFRLLLDIYDGRLGDVEGGLLLMRRLLETIPEYALLPAAQDAMGNLTDDTRARLSAIAISDRDGQIRALAHLRLFFSAERASDDASASCHLDAALRFSRGKLARMCLGLMLYDEAERAGPPEGISLARAGLELCDGMQPPFLLLASQIAARAERVDVSEVALRRLVMLHRRSIFWRQGLRRLVALLDARGRHDEAEDVILTNLGQLDVLSDNALARRAANQLTEQRPVSWKLLSRGRTH